MNRDLLCISDLTVEDVRLVISRTRELKELQLARLPHRRLEGRVVGLLFDKPSTRTRVSFEAGMYQLGGQVVFMSGRDTQLSRSEPAEDTAKVLSRYLDGLVVRTYGHDMVESLSQASSIPVINALTDKCHPCQVLSDLFTVLETKGRLDGLKYAWIGDGNNMANSWINAAAVLNLNLILACPEGYDPDPGFLEHALGRGARVTLTRDPREAAQGADVISTDVWASMGQEDEARDRARVFWGFTVDTGLLDLARAEAIVMHCLPAHRGEEITAEVLLGHQSVVFDQAENKMHLQKALLDLLLSESGPDR